MAREPKVIPFADAMPSDDFQVEEISNDEVLIGDPNLATTSKSFCSLYKPTVVMYGLNSEPVTKSAILGS